MIIQVNYDVMPHWFGGLYSEQFKPEPPQSGIRDIDTSDLALYSPFKDEDKDKPDGSVDAFAFIDAVPDHYRLDPWVMHALLENQHKGTFPESWKNQVIHKFARKSLEKTSIFVFFLANIFTHRVKIKVQKERAMVDKKTKRKYVEQYLVDETRTTTRTASAYWLYQRFVRGSYIVEGALGTHCFSAYLKSDVAIIKERSQKQAAPESKEAETVEDKPERTAEQETAPYEQEEVPEENPELVPTS